MRPPLSHVSFSVVVGFKNWGADRLEVAAQSIIRSFGPMDAELIISDYGSSDARIAEEVAETVGATVVRTVEDPVWSRSRALNAGFARARGQLLISTDADMVFSPETMQTIYRWWEQSPNSVYFLQCRDLPKDITARLLSGGGMDGNELEQASKLRPRWGMGGMMAISRAQFGVLRGFDERLHTYGREDMDFALRARRAGYRNVWIETPEARMYHMWHESSLTVSDTSDSVRNAVARNRKLVDEDKTWVRNLDQWRHPLQDREPLIRVVLMDTNSEDLTEQTIRSLQAQSFNDWEMLVIRDSSDPFLEQKIGKFDDKRVGGVEISNAGRSEMARALIIDSPGEFIMFLDSGCILPPDFLETQLSGFTEGVKAVQARQIDLQEGAMNAHSRSVDDACLGTIFHGQLARQIAKYVRNDFQLSELAAVLNSMDCEQAVDRNAVFFRVSERPDTVPNNGKRLCQGLDAAYMSYLPDGYIERVVDIEGGARHLESATFDGSLYGTHFERDGERLKSTYHIVNSTYRDMAWLRTNRLGFTVRIGEDFEARTDVVPRRFLNDAIEIASENSTALATAVIVVDGEALPDLRSNLGTVVSERGTSPKGEFLNVALIVFSEGDLRKALISFGGQIRMVLERYTDGDRIAD